VFCLKSASKREISTSVNAGSVYRIGWDSLTEVRPDGQPVAMPSNNSLGSARGAPHNR
jgi:hypothetical protein